MRLRLYIADYFATPPPTDRPRLWVERSPTPQHKKREVLSNFSFVLRGVLFSNPFLEDLAKIWALRYTIPDPSSPPLHPKVKFAK